MEATGYEGFRLVESRRLRQRAHDIGQSMEWFAHQRHLDTNALTADYPSLRESISTVAGQAAKRLRPRRGVGSGTTERPD
ncbi:MAG: hypothetical protein R2695_02980 [Acidimicrobiales bacterium]